MLQATKTTGDNDGESPTSQVQRPLQREVKSRRPKLHGRAFYESLGSPRVVLAPMVDQSEYVRTLSASDGPNPLQQNDIELELTCAIKLMIGLEIADALVHARGR